MKLLFIDETGDSKVRDYLGLSLAVMDSRSYPKLKTEAQAILKSIAWRPEVEFKGAYLFSQTKGCTEVEVERRVDAAERLIDLNAGKNARMAFHYGQMTSKEQGVDYQLGVPSLIGKVLPKAPRGAGKNLLAVTYDEREDLDRERFHHEIAEAVGSRGYVLLEKPIEGKSSFDTVGLMYADLVGYLAARVDVISNDAELFEGLSPEKYAENGKIRKLESSSELIDKIKRLDLYEAGLG